MSLLQRFESSSLKRILALDGGGIRGALSLGFLKKIEDILRKQHDNPDFRLYQYFDLIGGTSTGSIIAICLSIGMEVKEITNLYLKLGGEIFGDKYKWYKIFKRTKAKFNDKPLDERLQEVFKDITLGNDKIKTGLCIVAKRADTTGMNYLILAVRQLLKR